MALVEQNLGGGTGGGEDEGGNNLQSAGATYQITGNQIVMLSRKSLPPKNKTLPSVITILAAGGPPTFDDDDGKVDVRGAKGVRITAGSALMIPLGTSPPVTNASTDGVEIIVAEKQKITLQCGVQMPPPSQNFFQTMEMTADGLTLQSGANPTDLATVKMRPYSITLECAGQTGQPPGPQIKMIGGSQGWLNGSIELVLGESTIKINDSVPGVTIQSRGIKLSGAEGASTITLDAEGVTINGPVVNIKGGQTVNIIGTAVNIN
jgi:hypothetical protein